MWELATELVSEDKKEMLLSALDSVTESDLAKEQCWDTLWADSSVTVLGWQ